MTVIDIFAGPGGFDEALRMLGVPDVIGIELNADACATAEAAGHKRIQADVSMLDLRDFSGVIGAVGSPPCPSFSAAGKGLGKLDMGRILAHIEHIRQAGRWLHYSREGWHDPRSALVLEPLRYALHHLPDWVALEQVPAVLPIWQAICGVLRDHGYHADSVLLTAEQYGVAQTRKRAILTARRCVPWCPRQPSICVRSRNLLPAPTHRKYRKGVARTEGDPSLLPWVSMADALGIDLGDDWLLRSNYGTGGDPANRGTRTLDEPAPTVTGKIDRNKWVRFGNQPHSAIRSVDEPAAPLRFSQRMNACDWVVSTGNNSFTLGPGQRGLAGERDWRAMSKTYERSVNDPSPTVDGKAPHAWAVHLPGERAESLAAGTARRVSVQEAAILQSFRPDYPWQGSLTAQYRQCGDAIPPLLAYAVLNQIIPDEHRSTP